MNRRDILKGMAGLALCPYCAKLGFAAEGAHWSYEGNTGPAKWGELDDASRVCSLGTQQSPIDIAGAIDAKLPPLAFSWSKRASKTVNNGHTIQLDFAEGNSLLIGKSKYALLQFHFHHPSEHTVGGKSFPMEVHFVHRNAAGGLAVVGVLMIAGKSNPAFKKIVETMPQKKGETAADPAIDAMALLPAQHDYYRYPGSLTTPPCSETVDWHLLSTPVSVAEADIAAFARLYPMNARPVQKPYRRFVLKSG
jgi:carbonic anhydrase